MLYHLGAEGVLLVHFAFIAFVLFGALLALRWRWVIALHLPAAAWGLLIEVSGRICPLTYIENSLRIQAGRAPYPDSFIEHYLLAIIYPVALTREIQFVLAGVVVLVNATLYAWVLSRPRRPRHGVSLSK
jgi:hypothetical protein